MAWLKNWTHRVKITIDQDDIDATLTNFPILIYLSASSGRNSDDISFIFDVLESDNNRKKIAITTSDGTTQCFAEIEKWDDANEQAWLWVKVPSVASGADTDLYLYYDITKEDNTGYVDDTNSGVAENVWDSNFKFVCHMRDDPDTSNVRDSTDNNLDGSKKGAGEPAVTTNGKIADAQVFANDYITQATLLDDALSAVSIEFWFSPTVTFDSGATADEFLFNKQNITGEDRLNVWLDEGVGNIQLFTEYNNEGGVQTATSNATSWTGGTFYHFFLVFAGTTWTMYIDAVAQTNTATANGIMKAGTAADFIIGAGVGFSFPVNATIDEFRISGTDRNAAWIKAGYESGRDDLLDFGTAEGPVFNVPRRARH